jgi:hypothetical protein
MGGTAPPRVAKVTHAGRRLPSAPRAQRSTLSLRRRELVARTQPRKETAVNDLIYGIVTALGSISAFDDLLTGVASVVFCVCSAALFGVVFAGAF